MQTYVIKIDSDDSERIQSALSDMQKQLGVSILFYELNEVGSKKVDKIINV